MNTTPAKTPVFLNPLNFDPLSLGRHDRSAMPERFGGEQLVEMPAQFRLALGQPLRVPGEHLPASLGDRICLAVEQPMVGEDLMADAQIVRAAETVLYKKLQKSDDEKARSFVFEGLNEHQIVEQQLKLMARARNKASEQWTAQLTVLKELVNHHVKEEESTGFTCSRREFDRETLDKLGEQFRRQKEKLLAEA